MPVKIIDTLLWKPYPIGYENSIVRINQSSFGYAKIILRYLI